MRIQGFHHLAIQVGDVERVTRFYREVLGLPEQVRHLRPDGTVRSVWLQLPGSTFLAVEAASGPVEAQPFRTDRPGILLVALRIAREDRAAMVEELNRAGVPIVHQTRWTVYVQDPEGNRVALSHHPHDPLG
ncbi:MAG: VOC family protein [Myxococcota bacterium]|nr:VOC family protein [Myxococcota bacterium]